ncbi:MAG: hypothetical protein ABIJ31_02680 [Pseudomonadota bacterium]
MSLRINTGSGFSTYSLHKSQQDLFNIDCPGSDGASKKTDCGSF